MKITWLGQAGLMFETAGKVIIVDPYLSNSVEKIEPHNVRRVPVNTDFFKIKPDIILLTHNHLDHTDPETLRNFLTAEKSVTVLAPKNAWNTVRQNFNAQTHNFVMFNRHTVWSEENIKFTAIKAEHSDESAIGFFIETEEKSYYITGDTLYNSQIFGDLPKTPDYVFLPVNGKGNNMNMRDANAFCEKIGAHAVPLHCGLFDNTDMHDFAYKNKTVPKFYKEIKL